MQNNTQILVAVALVVVLGVGYFYYSTTLRGVDMMDPMATTTSESQVDDSGDAQVGVMTAKGNNTSNDALQKDAAKLDAELKALESDNATVNSSIQDAESAY